MLVEHLSPRVRVRNSVFSHSICVTSDQLLKPIGPMFLICEIRVTGPLTLQGCKVKLKQRKFSAQCLHVERAWIICYLLLSFTF